MIISKAYKENFFKYLIFEIIFAFVLMLTSVGLMLFWILLNQDSKRGTHYFEFFFENPINLSFVCLPPAILLVCFIFITKNKTFQVVGFELDNEKWYFLIKKINNNSIQRLTLVKNDSNVLKITPKGYKIFNEKTEIYFFTDGFVWENHVREKIYLKNDLNNHL